MLAALKTIVEQKSKPTELTAEVITQLFDYSATHTNYVVRYKASDTVIHVHSCN